MPNLLPGTKSPIPLPKRKQQVRIMVGFVSSVE